MPGSLKEAKDFLLRSPVQDVKDIAAGVAEIPGKIANFGQTISQSPAATVVRAPLSPEAFGVYGTAAGMLLPGIHEKLKGEAAAAPETPATEVPPAEAAPVPSENLQGVAGPTVESTTMASGDITPVERPGQPPEEVLPPDQTNIAPATEAEAANLEIGQNGQGGVPPEYTPQMGFPAPAVEGEVRPPAKVSQAITLEEIRLMREKADLELQAHISQRATGQTHPAIELRIGEIDQELQDIVNRELGQEPPRVIPEAGAAEPTEANLEVGQQERPLTKSELRASRKQEQGGEPSARSESKTTSEDIRGVRPKHHFNNKGKLPMYHHKGMSGVARRNKRRKRKD